MLVSQPRMSTEIDAMPADVDVNVNVGVVVGVSVLGVGETEVQVGEGVGLWLGVRLAGGINTGVGERIAGVADGDEMGSMGVTGRMTPSQADTPKTTIRDRIEKRAMLTSNSQYFIGKYVFKRS